MDFINSREGFGDSDVYHSDSDDEIYYSDEEESSSAVSERPNVLTDSPDEETIGKSFLMNKFMMADDSHECKDRNDRSLILDSLVIAEQSTSNAVRPAVDEEAKAEKDVCCLVAERGRRESVTHSSLRELKRSDPKVAEMVETLEKLMAEALELMRRDERVEMMMTAEYWTLKLQERFVGLVRNWKSKRQLDETLWNRAMEALNSLSGHHCDDGSSASSPTGVSGDTHFRKPFA